MTKCLSECYKGENVIVLSVNVGHRQKRRLANLGLFPGAVITKKNHAPFHGPLELIVKGSTLVIGRGIASKIFVRCRGECNE